MASLVLCTGCSFIASTTPKHASASCMPGRGPALVDAVVVATAVVADLGAGQCHATPEATCTEPQLTAAALSLLAAPYLVSAIYGVVKEPCYP
jgi:hypothetical protein